MREAISTACGLLAAFWLGWGTGTERERARHPDAPMPQPPRYNPDAEVDEDTLRRWETELGEGREHG